MAGFTSHDHLLNNVSALGKKVEIEWNKNANPSAAAVAGEWHTLFRGAGNPGSDAIFDAGTNLQYQSVFDVTTSAGCLQHGGNIGAAGDDFKVVLNAAAHSAAATSVPAVLTLVDVLAFMRVTTVTTTTAQTVVQANTFTASSSSGLLLTFANDWSPYQKVRFTTTTTLPTGLSLATDYWLVRVSATTARVATSLANALAGTVVAFTDAGTGTHTLTCRLPRYSDGAGVQAILFNPAATALGAATPSLSLASYTNSAGTAGRSTPVVLPIGKTASSNSHILYSGATGSGKYGPYMPRAAGDAGIRSVETVQNSTSYVSGSYTVALVKEILRLNPQVLGQESARDYITQFPSFPRVYDGAALYWLLGSGAATPGNTSYGGRLELGWS